MAHATRVLGRSALEVAAPPGWESAQSDHGIDLHLLCAGALWRNAHVVMRAIPQHHPEPIEAHCLASLAGLYAERPDVLVASVDVWPHPVWGMGRCIQSAYLEGDGAIAHERYLFADDSSLIVIDVTRSLDDMLTLEEEIALIVAATRPLRG